MIEIMNSGTGMVIVNFTIYGTQCVAYLPIGFKLSWGVTEYIPILGLVDKVGV